MAGLHSLPKGEAPENLTWEDLGLPPKVQPLRQAASYKALYGGRGAGRSWSFARMSLYRSVRQRIRVMCAREYQTSIRESVHHVICRQIDLLGLEGFFKISDRSIVGANGSEYLFIGLKNDPRKVKSAEEINLCWVEEAENISKASWDILLPTIFRETGSELWVSFNPKKKSDPTYRMFVGEPLPGARVIKLNWQDNPYFPEELKRLMEHCRATDMDAYRHIWEGECEEHAAAEVFKGKWSVAYFEPQREWQGPYYGGDLGFAEDPTTLVRTWVAEEGPWRDLYVEELVYEVGLDLDRMAPAFEAASQNLIRLDNSRPETISYLRRRGLNAVACRKGPHSVEEGIRFLRSFRRIIIHSDSRNFKDEAENYKYRVDELTGEVLPVLINRNNHCWDALRYAVEPLRQDGEWTEEMDLS